MTGVPGRFYVIDGPDGSGKTTQAARLATELKAKRATVAVLREPGGTAAGEAIRDLLLDPDTDVTSLAEMLLYQAARAQLVEAVIRPALEAGQVVILDRYWYSTAAYQGSGLGLSEEDIRRVSTIATDGLEPDHVFILDVDPETAFGRLDGRRDRIEGRPLEYHRRVRDGFLAVARQLEGRCTVIDAMQSLESVTRSILEVCERL